MIASHSLDNDPNKEPGEMKTARERAGLWGHLICPGKIHKYEQVRIAECTTINSLESSFEVHAAEAVKAEREKYAELKVRLSTAAEVIKAAEEQRDEWGKMAEQAEQALLNSDAERIRLGDRLEDAEAKLEQRGKELLALREALATHVRVVGSPGMEDQWCPHGNGRKNGFDSWYCGDCMESWVELLDSTAKAQGGKEG